MVIFWGSMRQHEAKEQMDNCMTRKQEECSYNFSSSAYSLTIYLLSRLRKSKESLWRPSCLNLLNALLLTVHNEITAYHVEDNVGNEILLVKNDAVKFSNWLFCIHLIK